MTEFCRRPHRWRIELFRLLWPVFFWCIMFALNPKSARGFCIALAAIAAGTAVLSELNAGRGSEPLLWIMVSRFGIVAVFAALGLYAAQQSQMRGGGRLC